MLWSSHAVQSWVHGSSQWHQDEKLATGIAATASCLSVHQAVRHALPLPALCACPFFGTLVMLDCLRSPVKQDLHLAGRLPRAQSPDLAPPRLPPGLIQQRQVIITPCYASTPAHATST